MGDFLGTGATFSADLNLVLQIAMGLALLGGMFLARAGRIGVHRYLQSTVVLGNLFLIGFIMVPSLFRQVTPYIPSHLGTDYYWVAVVHGILGAATELLGLYVVVSAGTNLLPERLRFRNYKLWMRSLLFLWWAVLLLGIGVHYVWYLAPGANIHGRAGSNGSHSFTILISNYRFTPKVATIVPGTRVTWLDSQGMHAVQSLSKTRFDSSVLSPGQKYRFTFTKPGTYHYDCAIHGTLMSARIVVS